MSILSCLIIAVLITACPCLALAEAGKAFTPCNPIPGQYRRVHIPPLMGKLLLEDERRTSGPDFLARRTGDNDPDPNKLHIAYEYDLNGDGVNEYLIRTSTASPTWVAMNSPLWVVQRGKDGGYETILEGYGGVGGGPVVISSKENGYRNICTSQYNGAAEKVVTIFRFNSGSLRYEPAECRILVYDLDDHKLITRLSCD